MSNETLLTIAQRTGYSISTVSRVLSGSAKKYRIGDKTVEIIKEEARKCHYTPSLLAKGLRNKETNTIGLLIPSLENYFFSNLASTVITEATVFGYTVIIVCTQEKEQNEAECLRQLMSRRVDGIVAVPSGHSPKEFEMIAEQVPIILIDRYFESSSLPYICTDNYCGALMATEYLINHGHKRITCIQGPPFQTPVRERVRGYNDALKNAGLSEYSNVAGEDFTIQNGYIETKLVLSYNDRPTAILALSNTILLGAIKAISESQMKISDDISIISFDNNQFLDYMTPSITRIEQPIQEIGILAIRTIVKRIHGNSAPEHNSIQLMPRIIVGDSVKNLK